MLPEAILQLVRAVVELHLETLRAMPEAERAEYARMVLADMKFWRNVARAFLPPGTLDP